MKVYSSRSVLRNSWMIVAVVTILALFLSMNWYYYRRMREGLDREFSARLKSLASLVSSSIGDDELEGLAGGGDSPPPYDRLTSRLEALREGFAISNISIVREDGEILFSLHAGLLPPGEVYPLWNMDYPAIIRALDGTPSSTALIRGQDGNYFKAGYAPVPLDSRHARTVAAVEANAVFLEGLHELRSILLAATTISVIGLVIFILFVVKAASSLVRTRESLLQAETLAAMGRMAAGIAHEIRNPLFIIRSSAEKLRERCPESASNIDEFILEETDRLDGILTDYLLFARNEETEKQAGDLAGILRRCVRTADDGGDRIRFESSTGEAPVLCEEKKLQQVFLNIILNAFQSSVDGSPVTVRLDRHETNYRVRISDSGEGITGRDLEKVFEPFYTTKPQGSGLGLAIARRIVEDHSGKIEIESRPGTGTTVTVSLPCYEDTAGDSDEQSTYYR